MSRLVRWSSLAAAAFALGLPAAATAQTWTIEPVPAPSGVDSSHLDAVSCPAAGSCIAVGTWENGSQAPPGYTDQPFYEQLSGGTWTEANMPAPPNGNNVVLGGVSCSEASACTAVGYTMAPNYVVQQCQLGGDCGPNPGPGPSWTYTAFAERWNGQTWKLQSVVTPSPETQLLGISCSSASSCTAVGNAYGLGADPGGTGSSGGATEYVTPLEEMWNGSSWSTHGGEDPPDAGLSGVSCLSSSTCFAAGGGPAGPLAVEWDGTYWVPQDSIGASTTTNDAFSGVSCTGTSVCTAVGSNQGTGTSATSFAEQLTGGGAWQFQPIASPAGTSDAALSGVSCVRSSACAAVGTYYTGSGDTANPWAADWNGSTWTTLPVPSPAGSTGSGLASVSCAGDGTCIAVGDGAAGDTPLVERYS